MENAHKRGRSFESGFPLKNKDDDLALFKDMQNRERDNFLLHTSYDFEDSICNSLCSLDNWYDNNSLLVKFVSSQ